LVVVVDKHELVAIIKINTMKQKKNKNSNSKMSKFLSKTRLLCHQRGYWWIRVFAILISAFTLPCATFAQSWVDRLDEVRIALDKYKDCKTAERILQEIKSDAQGEIMYKFYEAKIYQCKGDLAKYRDYLVEFNKIKNDPTIKEEIAELNYQLTKNKVEAEERAQAASERYDFTSGIYVLDSDERKKFEVTVNNDRTKIKIKSHTGNYFNFEKTGKGEYEGSLTRLLENMGTVTVKTLNYPNPNFVYTTQYPCKDIDPRTQATLEVVNSKELQIGYLNWELSECKKDAPTYLNGVYINQILPCPCTSNYVTLDWEYITLVKQ
jgi:hypothetical protein